MKVHSAWLGNIISGKNKKKAPRVFEGLFFISSWVFPCKALPWVLQVTILTISIALTYVYIKEPETAQT